MKNMQKIGAISSFILAFAYIFGIAFGLTVLNTEGITDPLAKLTFHVDNYKAYYIWIALIYINSGIFLIPLSLSIKERIDHFSKSSSILSTPGAVYGIVWAGLLLASGLLHNTGLLETVRIYQDNPQRALEFWHVIETIHLGIGAETEIPGGIWSILVGIAGLKTLAFPKWINIVGITAGCAGLLTIIPPLMDYAIIIYAFGHILWWISMGTVMIRKKI